MGLVVVLSILLQVKVVIFILIDDVYNYDVNIQIKWWYLVHVYCSEESCLEGKDDILRRCVCRMSVKKLIRYHHVRSVVYTLNFSNLPILLSEYLLYQLISTGTALPACFA